MTTLDYKTITPLITDFYGSLQDRINREYGIETRLYITNHTGKLVKAGFRLGLELEVPRQNIPGIDGIIVTYSLTIDTKGLESLVALLNENISAGDNSKEYLTRILKEGRLYRYKNRQILFIDFKVSYTDIERLGGVVYLQECDLLLNITDKVAIHPYSYEGIRLGLNVDHLSESSFNLGIDFVNDKQSHLYVKQGNSIHTIKARTSRTKRNGVYLLVGDKENRVPKVIDLEDKETLAEYGIFRTFDECVSDRHESYKLERLLEERRLELESKVLDDKAKYLKAKAEMESLKLNLERESNLNKQLMEEHKHKLERKSLDRKDESEVLKHIPMLLVGIGAAFYTLKQLMKP